MPKLVLFLLGKKGYQILNAAVSDGFKNSLCQVVVGTDRQMQQDFAEEIIDLCEVNGIDCCIREDSSLVLVKPDECIAIAAGWRWLIKDNFRQLIVFHDSLLPKYRGFNPLVTALLHKDTRIGVTAIIARNEFDRGDIIESKAIDVQYPIKIADAIDRVSEVYFDLAKLVFGKLNKVSSLVGVAQDETKASYSVWRDEDDYRIDWSNSSEEILHFLNCVSFPYKGAATLYEADTIRIFAGEIVEDVEIANRDVGKVLFVSNGYPVVICGAGLLRITDAVDDNGASVLPFKKFRVRLK
jgi:methionyl-tRNA formyltransferase